MDEEKEPKVIEEREARSSRGKEAWMGNQRRGKPLLEQEREAWE